MKFYALTNVPGKITEGKTYEGAVVTVVHYCRVGEVQRGKSLLRIALHDDTCEWLTLNPMMFVPATKTIDCKLIELAKAKWQKFEAKIKIEVLERQQRQTRRPKPTPCPGPGHKMHYIREDVKK